ncbi:MAG: heme-binding domain-containing protein [Sphaerobacter sp.]|nr:heme-binding domain-containing protein [Sphaerobacter sp.]
MIRKVLTYGLGTLAVLLVAIQFVPYGRDHRNPPVTQEPAWDSAQTRELARRACFDCHSNETRWPWYTNVAPVSWLVQRDVEEGRAKLNFSAWDRPEAREEAGESAKTVREGEMPPWYYLPLHPEARLSPEEQAALIRGLEATFGSEREGGH